MSYSIQVKGLSSLLANLKTATDVRRLNEALMKGAVYLRGVLATYPPRKHITRRSVYGTPFQSAKQKRWFFWALRTGKIKVPYVRTRTLEHKWSIASRGPLTVVVGNNTPYAKWVMDADQPQSRFMRASGWRTAQEIAATEEKKVMELIMQDIQAKFEGKG